MSNQKKSSTQKKPVNPFGLLSLFQGSRKRDDLLLEAKIDTPFVTIVNTFKSNKTAMAAFWLYVFFAVTVLVGPLLMPIDLSFTDSTQSHIPPIMNLMSVPKEIEGNIADIVVGPKFTFALTKDGQLKTWGDTKITSTVDIGKLPKNMGKIVKIAIGADHALALNDQGKVFGWGSDRLKQATIPMEVQQLTNIKAIYAGYQASIVLTEDGRTFFFGNTMINDFNQFHAYQGQIDQVLVTADAFTALTKDGKVVFLGTQKTTFADIPADMGKIVQLTSTDNAMAALNEDGKVFVWGNATPTRGEKNVPQPKGKIIAIDGGRNHLVLQSDQGEVLAWGDNYYKQTNVPKKIQGLQNTKVFVGGFQNYAVLETGKVVTWGLKGYLFGTDDLGRDTFTRLIHGGRMTMTIGLVSVAISATIGIILGGLSGYLGGAFDMFVQRLGEIISAVPMLPLIMIFSAVIGNRLNPMQKIYMVMVLIGVVSWVGLMRLVRSLVFSIREQEYVTAARAIGIKEAGIVFKHIVPNAISMIIVSITLSLAYSLLTESSLSFLGFGVQAPHPTWGNMLNGARSSIVIQNYWWRWVFPSISLATLVIAINLIGDGIGQAIDPKSQER